MIKAAAVCIVHRERSSAAADNDVMMLPAKEKPDTAADLWV